MTDAAATDEAVTDAAATDEAATDAAATDEAGTDEAGTDEVAAGEVVSDEVASDEATSDEVGTDEAASDEVDADEAETDESVTDESVADESVTDETASDEATAGGKRRYRSRVRRKRAGGQHLLCQHAGQRGLRVPFGRSAGHLGRRLRRRGWRSTPLPRAAQRRDAELSAQAGQGAHRVAGTVVIRLSSALSAQERETLMEEVLEALTTAQPGESVALSESPQRLGALLTVGESGFVMDGDRLYYALTLSSTIPRAWTLEFPPRARDLLRRAGRSGGPATRACAWPSAPGRSWPGPRTSGTSRKRPYPWKPSWCRPRSRDFIDDSALCAPLEVRSRRHRAGGRGGDARLRTLQPQRF